jgi:hypothetical protein
MNEISNDHGARGNADADAESLGRRAQLAHRLDQLQARGDGLLGIILMGRRVTEICKNAVTQISGDQASAGLYNCRRLTKIGGKDVIKIFRIEALSE